MYLTSGLKDYYLSDFEKVLLLKDDYQRVKDYVRSSLIQINKNPRIQTLYHHTYSPQLGSFTIEGSSSLTIAYKIEAESKLFEFMDECRRQLGADNFLFSVFEPGDNFMYNAESCFDIGCYKNSDYFRLKHIRIEFISADDNEHQLFFQTVTDGLKIL